MVNPCQRDLMPFGMNCSNTWKSVLAMAVDERHHTDVMHLPLATYICSAPGRYNYRTSTKKHPTLPPLPSHEWIRLQFWPENLYSNATLRYTAGIGATITKGTCGYKVCLKYVCKGICGNVQASGEYDISR